MTDKSQDLVEVDFHCYPDHDLDAALASDVAPDPDYCWTLVRGQVPAHLLGKLSGQGVCPECGNTVDIVAVTALGTFLRSARGEESDGEE